MSNSGTAGYDRQITIFSPEGRLYQVEYAFKAINNEGITSIGLKGQDCAVIISQRKIADKLIESSTMTRIFKITRNIGAVTNGPIADCRALVNRARHEASDYSYKYGHSIPVHLLARRIANLNQLSTQEAAMRPLACVLTLIAFDFEVEAPQLFKCDPAGFYAGYHATATGPKSIDLTNALEKKKLPGHSHFGASLDETVETGISTLATALSQEFKSSDIEVGYVSASNSIFTVLSEAEIDSILTKLAEKD